MKKNKKVDFKESGPYGVGNSVEDIKNLDVFEHLQTTEAFKHIMEDLTEEQRKHVLEESELFSGRWQKVLNHMSNVLSTPEGQKEFLKQFKKKAGR